MRIVKNTLLFLVPFLAGAGKTSIINYPTFLSFIFVFLILQVLFYIPLKTPRIRINSQGKGEGQRWEIQRRTMLLGGYDQSVRHIYSRRFPDVLFSPSFDFSTQGDPVLFPSMEIAYEAAFQWARIIRGVVVEDNEERKAYFALAMWTRGNKNVSIS